MRGPLLRVHRGVAANLLVDDALDPLLLVDGDRLEMDEIESQAIRRDERSRLLDVTAEHLAKRRVQQMRRGVIAPRGVAHVRVDLGGHRYRRLCSVPWTT